MNQSRCASLHCNTAKGPQLQRNTPGQPPRGSRATAITQAGLFGLNFGTVSSTDVQTQKQEVLSSNFQYLLSLRQEPGLTCELKRLEINLCQLADAVQLLSAIQPLQRGVSATDADQQHVEKLIQKLEKVNPNKKSLASPLINGKWKLLYTTSESILGSKRPAILRANGPIYQYIGDDHMLMALELLL